MTTNTLSIHPGQPGEDMSHLHPTTQTGRLLMSTYRFAVKVWPSAYHLATHAWACGGCKRASYPYVSREHAHASATAHAARCEALHRANHAAYCPECDRWGRIAPACPLCLGEGWIPTTDAARKGLT